MGQIENAYKPTKISADFLYLKILGQPQFLDAYRSEIKSACIDPRFVEKIGASWDDVSFESVAEIAIKVCMRDKKCLEFAKNNWNPNRYNRLKQNLDSVSGGFSLVDEKDTGKLFLSEDENGRLSIPGTLDTQ